MGLLGLALVAATFLVNVVNDLASDNRHHFGHATKVVLGFVGWAGLLLMLLASVWAVAASFRGRAPR